MKSGRSSKLGVQISPSGNLFDMEYMDDIVFSLAKEGETVLRFPINWLRPDIIGVTVMMSGEEELPSTPSALFSPSGVMLNVSFTFILMALFHLLRRTACKLGCSFTGASPAKSSALSELRLLRESGLRDSERVVDLWYSTVRHSTDLGHDKWTILEQVFIAALDVADDRLAWECLERLKTQFKKSSRVDRLTGMYLEKNGRFDDAHAVYTQLLNDDPTNTLARKRMIAILKAQRKNVEAIYELRQYLKIFMSDFEAWNELTDLYLVEGDFKHAAFCMEELILSNPHNHLYCQRYAEIKYTEGGSENLELARAYFSRSCQLNPNNLRSLYGLLLACSALDHHLSSAPLGSVPVLSWKEAPQPSPGSKKIKSTTSHLFNSVPPGNTLDMQSVMQFASAPSNAELNRYLARWAGQQIRQIYDHCDHVFVMDANACIGGDK
ncbi:hypothetical protein T265_00567 [Opisthorchis viverrini]|uniref:ER membrane protein complex subunit 2 n=2 Tax=Opisthorchis viverrini TaxID=6198 RepID=A0A075ACN6_OPIVI|nr:hypothetical protein T265_00567 [Opisthorchis viverrini]KER33685.1 hypothetical protein T265_00567 [Opisthorchis viverrini]